MAAKSLYIIAFLASLTISANGQKTENVPVYRCSELLHSYSEDWRKDSLANNGFRHNHYKYFLKSSIDSIRQNQVSSSLGKPDRIRETNLGVEWLYYFFNAKTHKDKNVPLAIWYIAFQFQNNGQYLSRIVEGDIDL